MLVSYDIDTDQGTILMKFENGGVITIVTITNRYSREVWENFYDTVRDWLKNPSHYQLEFDYMTMCYENQLVYFYTPNTYTSISLLNAGVHFVSTLKSLIDDSRMIPLWVEEMDF